MAISFKQSDSQKSTVSGHHSYFKHNLHICCLQLKQSKNSLHIVYGVTYSIFEANNVNLTKTNKRSNKKIITLYLVMMYHLLESRMTK